MTGAMKWPHGVGNDARFGEFVDRNTMRFVRDFTHPASLVWEALTDAKQIAHWFWPCVLFEAKQGGRYKFADEGLTWGGTITTFDPPSRLELDMGLLFELFEDNGRCRLVLTLKRQKTGWAPMTLAGFMGWLGRLTRHIEGTPQEETERFCSDIWEGVWSVYERLLRHNVTDGARAIYRLHFAVKDAALDAESKAHLDELVSVMRSRGDLNVVIEGFGSDPISRDESVALSSRRMAAAADYLKGAGVDAKRIINSFALGNYHPLVPNDTEAGRAFNRRIELRPTY